MSDPRDGNDHGGYSHLHKPHRAKMRDLGLVIALFLSFMFCVAVLVLT